MRTLSGVLRSSEYITHHLVCDFPFGELFFRSSRVGPPTFSPSGPVGSCFLSSFFLWLQALSFLGDLFLFSHTRAHSPPLVFLHLKLLQVFFSQHRSWKSACTAVSSARFPLVLSQGSVSAHEPRQPFLRRHQWPAGQALGLGCAPARGLVALLGSLRPTTSPFSLPKAGGACARVMGVSLVSRVSPSPYLTVCGPCLPVSGLSLLVFFPPKWKLTNSY